MREGVAEGERRFKDGPGWRRNLGELKGDGCRRHDEEGTRPAERGERRQKKGRKEESPNRRGAVGIADSVCVHGVCLALSLCGSRCHCLTGGNAIILLLLSRNRRGRVRKEESQRQEEGGGRCDELDGRISQRH